MSDDLNPAPVAPEPLTRADTADYLDRANWDPDKARAMAAQERLSNLGAHPDVVAQAVAPQMPQVASAAPAPSIPPARVAPQPGRVVSITPPAPKPVKKAAPAKSALTPDAFMAQQAPAGTSELTPDSFMAQQAPPAPVAPAEPPSPGEIPLTSPLAATEQGFNRVAEGAQHAVKGAVDMVMHPIDTAKSLLKAPGALIDAAKQVPAAIHDINQSEDPTGTYLNVAGRTAGEAAGQDLVALATMPKASTLPKTATIADTELPLTVGQARAQVLPGKGGVNLKPLEELTKQLPGGGPLRRVAAEQQAGAREILAGKAAKTGAEVSSAPDAIEQNFANAVEKTRQEGSAKYEAIADAAKNADLTPTTQSAVDILGDPETAKLLPPSARNALAKVGAAASERDAIARQIYGRAASTLDPDELANVIKAEKTAPEANFPSISGGAMRGVMDARAELADAAHGLKDPADRFRVGKALDSFDDAVNKSLDAHDKLNGTTLGKDLQEAKQLWTQKYAFDNFRKGMQQVMRGTPVGGPREINGQAFQRLVNKLDPLGKLSKQKSTLERMFPGDAQSVKDIHDLADFMGKNQARAGGMGGMMARMRILGLKESAVGFLTNAAGFSSLMARRGLAHNILQALKGGKSAVALTPLVTDLNHLADGVDSGRQAGPPSSPQSSSGSTDSLSSSNSDLNAATSPLNSSLTPSSSPDTTQTTAITPSTSSSQNIVESPSDKETTTAPAVAQVPESGTNEKRKGFDHPSRQADKEAGWMAALKSKKTPGHLKPHLEKNLSQ